ncbi:TetR/AcrR family transcriptional regulator [Bacillus massiliigorillae]|uniref:TetR/AcrR family transcriptional regulator n=1 Tax=Bacillus massiliigorillae TaxID=1243664 RepID=UPI0003A89101|nr:TetR/AcrR family transcriptional regulator [Bacillus massiliigorillae]
MNPLERLSQERLDGRNRRMKSIIETAEKLFLVKGFEKTTMQDIADEEGIGVATVFRYFPRKEKLVVSVAVHIMEKKIAIFESVNNLDIPCIEKLDQMFDFFMSLNLSEFQNHTRLLDAFESYAALSEQPLEGIENYFAAINRTSKIFEAIIEQGKLDGSIRTDIEITEAFISITYAFASFSRKLTIFQSISITESGCEFEKQHKILKNIFLDYLRAK